MTRHVVHGLPSTSNRWEPSTTAPGAAPSPRIVKQSRFHLPRHSELWYSGPSHDLRSQKKKQEKLGRCSFIGEELPPTTVRMLREEHDHESAAPEDVGKAKYDHERYDQEQVEPRREAIPDRIKEETDVAPTRYCSFSKYSINCEDRIALVERQYVANAANSAVVALRNTPSDQ